jgi:hypothetical protein
VKIPQPRKPRPARARHWVSRYTVTAADRDLTGVFDITVELVSADRWAVRHDGHCLGRDGVWDHEPDPAARDGVWLDWHRMDLPTALALAERAAPDLMVNGRRAAGGRR